MLYMNLLPFIDWSPFVAVCCHSRSCMSHTASTGGACCSQCRSLELPGRVWLALWPAANPGRCRRTLCVRAKLAVGGVERVEIKKKIENDGLRNGKKCKMVMLRTGFFGHL